MIRHALLAAALMLAAGSPTRAETGDKLAGIIMTFGTTEVTAALIDTPPSRDLLARLPTTIAMSLLLEREYTGRPQPPFSADGTRQQGYANGDIGYWAPGGYLAVFFDKGGEADISDLIVMGKVTSDLSVLENLGPAFDVRIERLDSAGRTE